MYIGVARGRGARGPPPSNSDFFFLEFKRVVCSPERSDVTEVMIYRDTQDTDNVS